MSHREQTQGRRERKAVYYQKWLEENGDERNERRRDRYASDSAYAEQIRKRSRDRKRALLAERKGRVPRVINGKEILVYPMAHICRALGIKSAKIRAWEKAGWLPPALFDGLRVYTEHQFAMIRELVQRAEVGKDTKTIRARIQSEWTVGI
jgi:hypothetical protein